MRVQHHLQSALTNKLPCIQHPRAQDIAHACVLECSHCHGDQQARLAKTCAHITCVHESMSVQYLTALATLLAATVAIACSAGSLTRCRTGGVGLGSTMMPGPGLADTEKLCLRSDSVGSSVLRLCKHAVLLTAHIVYALLKY